MTKTVRLIGGTQHGTTQKIDNNLRTIRLHACEPNRYITAMDAAHFGADLNIETYERRTYDLGGAFAEVFVLDRLTDRQAIRALADLIEGVQR